MIEGITQFSYFSTCLEYQAVKSEDVQKRTTFYHTFIKINPNIKPSKEGEGGVAEILWVCSSGQ